ncbi:hypothetical protein [Aegicerativicinus sediminis]|uniref:hypothetical protein n=1 Tax=Aegicerativicinus sediminis TaxID=2893202 RepID=UPI001E40EFB7|nr:hypothetical protein [Aegicerativicinus sediminis]
MKFHYKHTIITLIITLIISIQYSYGQCAMCRAVLESESGQSTAEGVNNGIIYLMIFPYLLIGGIAYFIYYQFFRAKRVKKA